jgi:hypothetical protein
MTKANSRKQHNNQPALVVAAMATAMAVAMVVVDYRDQRW